MSVDLAGFLGVVLLAYVVPGPDFLVIVRAAARRPPLGRAAALGAQTGLCVHMSAAPLGLSVTAAEAPLAFTAGRRLPDVPGCTSPAGRPTRHRRRHTRATEPGPCSAEHDAGHEFPAAAGISRRDSFVQGSLTKVLNPKAALFFLSILPQFTYHGGSPTERRGGKGDRDRDTRVL